MKGFYLSQPDKVIQLPSTEARVFATTELILLVTSTELRVLSFSDMDEIAVKPLQVQQIADM